MEVLKAVASKFRYRADIMADAANDYRSDDPVASSVYARLAREYAWMANAIDSAIKDPTDV